MRLLEPCPDRVERAAPALAFADATGTGSPQRLGVAVVLFENAVGLALDPVQRFRDQVDRDGIGDERNGATRGSADAGDQPGGGMRERIEIERVRQLRALVVEILYYAQIVADRDWVGFTRQPRTAALLDESLIAFDGGTIQRSEARKAFSDHPPDQREQIAGPGEQGRLTAAPTPI